MRLVWDVLESNILPKHAKGKLVMISLANYAREDGTGWTTSTALKRHAGCSKQHVITLKKLIAEAGLVDFYPQTGRGGVTKYQINIDVLQSFSGQDKGSNELTFGLNKGSTRITLKGQVGMPKRSTGVDPISIKENKRARARGTRDIKHDLTRTAAQEVGRHDLGDGAPVFREMFEQKFGAGFSRSWIDQCSIDASSDGVEISAPLAFVKSSIENQCSAWLYEHDARVVVAKVDERAAS